MREPGRLTLGKAGLTVRHVIITRSWSLHAHIPTVTEVYFLICMPWHALTLLFESSTLEHCKTVAQRWGAANC